MKIKNTEGAVKSVLLVLAKAHRMMDELDYPTAEEIRNNNGKSTKPK